MRAGSSVELPADTCFKMTDDCARTVASKLASFRCAVLAVEVRD
jgi:hypothetical protein